MKLLRSILLLTAAACVGCGSEKKPAVVIKDPQIAQPTREEAPVAQQHSLTTQEDAPVTVDVLAKTPAQQAQNIRVIIVGRPAHGTAKVLENGRIEYNPELHFHGRDEFKYRLESPAGNADASVTVNVTHVNHAPVAADDAVQVRDGASVTWNISRKSSDVDGDTLTIKELGKPANGSVRTTDTRNVVYTPAPGFSGEDSFQYTVSDGQLASGQATVKVRVLPAIPRFWRTEHKASLSEMLVESGSSIYGSSINLWVYGATNGSIEQVVVTGHADSSTCRNVSSLLFTAYLQKTREPADLLVAGTGLLQNRSNPELRRKLESTEEVRDYLALEGDLRVARILYEIVRNQKTPPEKGESAIEKAKKEVERLEKEVEAAAKKGQVPQYIALIKSDSAIRGFVSETSRVAGETGLVKVHRLDARLATQAVQRIDAALAAGRESDYVRFDDLTKASKAADAVIILPVKVLQTREPLVLKLPRAKLNPTKLQESLEESRQEITHAMVGNAKERLDYLKRQRKQTADGLESYKKLLESLSPEARKIKRAEKILLGKIITPDVEYDDDKPIETTLGEYVDFRLPQNLRLVDQWIAETQELLDRIERDAKEKNQSAIEHVAYCTILDSMLRDWDLPIARSQRAFNNWRKTQREPAWDALNEMLMARGLAKEAISGENVVFSVKLVGDMIEIHPTHVLDLNNSVLLLDKRLGVTRVVNRWAERVEEKAAPLEVNERDERARTEITKMHKALQAGNISGAEQHWVLAREANARIAVESLLKAWASEFPAQSVLSHRLREEIRPRIAAQELVAEWSRIHDDPRYKEIELEKQGEYLLALYRFLEANPSAPAEWHFQFLRNLAAWIAAVQKEITNQKQTESEWIVLDRLVVNPPAFDGENAPYYRARLAVSKLLLSGEDPAKLLRTVANLARKVDPDYTERALKDRKQPETVSQSLRGLFEKTKQTFTEFQFDALRLERVRQLMRSRADADLAATLLLVEERPSLDLVLKHVQNALQTELGSQNVQFRAARQKIESLKKLPGGLNRLQTAEIVSALENGELLLLRRSENTLREDSQYRGLRELALLRARLQFEKGEYNTAITGLFDDRVTLALYHPDLKWTTLPGDWTGNLLKLRAHATGAGSIRVVATRPPVQFTGLSTRLSPFYSALASKNDFETDFPSKQSRESLLPLLAEDPVLVLTGLLLTATDGLLPPRAWESVGLAGRPRLVRDKDTVSLKAMTIKQDYDVLDVTGLPPDACEQVMKVINESGPRDWGSAGRVSEQILLLRVPGRPVLTAYKNLFAKPAVRDSLIKAMVYGSVLPDADSFPGSGRWLETSRSRPIYDRLLTQSATKVSVPSLEAIIADVKSGKIVSRLLSPSAKPAERPKADGQTP